MGEHARWKSAMINYTFVLRMEKIVRRGVRPRFALQQRCVRVRLTPMATNQYDLRDSLPRVHEKCQKNTSAYRSAGAFQIDPESKKK